MDVVMFFFNILQHVNDDDDLFFLSMSWTRYSNL